MAAHKFMALQEIIRDNYAGRLESEKSYLAAALNNGCWTEELDSDEYQAFCKFASGAMDKDEFLGHAIDALKVAYTEWVTLGKPATREEWLSKRYNIPIEDLFKPAV